jgi:hypothetical protein
MGGLCAGIRGIRDRDRLAAIGAQIKIVLLPGKVFPRTDRSVSRVIIDGIIRASRIQQQGSVVEPTEALGIEGSSADAHLKKHIGVGTVPFAYFVVVAVKNRRKIRRKAGSRTRDRVTLRDGRPVSVAGIAVPGKDESGIVSAMDIV